MFTQQNSIQANFWYCKTYGTERSYGGNDGYQDNLETQYEYHQFVKNWRRIKPGDFLLLCDRSQALGLACVQRIEVSNGTILRRRCPSCSATDIHERKQVSPRWRCRNGHEFTNPTEETIECSLYRASYPNNYFQFDSALSLSDVLSARLNFAAIDSIVLLDANRIRHAITNSLSSVVVSQGSELPPETPKAPNSIAGRLDLDSFLVDDFEATQFPEGARLYRLHLTRERNTKLVRCAKWRAKLISGRLICEACGFDFFETYGSVGEDYIECHHTVPISDLAAGSSTRMSDIVLLCSNCHRIVHRGQPWLTLESLKEILQQTS